VAAARHHRLVRAPIAERLTAQGLAGEPLRSPEAVAARLLAVQGQDPRGARLAIRARSEGVTAADVDRALTEERSLLITWLNRGTLHLVRSEDYPRLQALTTTTTPPLMTSNARRLRQEGVSPDVEGRAVKTIERALADEGPLTRPQLRERLDGAGVPTPVDREQALAELARRYLAGHAPADDRDLARWAGLEAIASELVEREDGLVELAKSPEPAPMPPPRLLGAFDPLLLGWTSREEVVGPHKLQVTANGVFRPFGMVDGRAVATWRLSNGKVAIQHLGKVKKQDAAALEAEAEAVLEFMNAESARSVESRRFSRTHARDAAACRPCVRAAPPGPAAVRPPAPIRC
jgi:hypothetical protein